MRSISRIDGHGEGRERKLRERGFDEGAIRKQLPELLALSRASVPSSEFVVLNSKFWVLRFDF